MTCGLAVKAVSAYILIDIPDVAAMGAPISTLLCNLCAVILNLWFIGKYTSFDLKISGILNKPMLAASVSAAVSLGVYIIVDKLVAEERIAFLCALLSCVTVYLAILLFGDLLDTEEYKMLPMGDKIMTLKINKKQRIKNEKGRTDQSTFGKRKISF